MCKDTSSIAELVVRKDRLPNAEKEDILNQLVDRLRPLLRSVTLEVLGDTVRLSGAHGGGRIHGHCLNSDLRMKTPQNSRLADILGARGFFFWGKPHMQPSISLRPIRGLWGIDRNGDWLCGYVTLERLVNTGEFEYETGVDVALVKVNGPDIIAGPEGPFAQEPRDDIYRSIWSGLHQTAIDIAAERRRLSQEADCIQAQFDGEVNFVSKVI